MHTMEPGSCSVVCGCCSLVFSSSWGSWRDVLCVHRGMFNNILARTIDKFFSHHGHLTLSPIIICVFVFIARTQDPGRWMSALFRQKMSELPISLLCNPTLWHRIGLLLHFCNWIWKLVHQSCFCEKTMKICFLYFLYFQQKMKSPSNRQWWRIQVCFIEILGLSAVHVCPYEN